VKALQVCFSTAISSSAFNSKNFYSHHRGASDVANNVAHHTMLPTMSITMSPTMLADISMRLRKRHDSQIHRAVISGASTVSGPLGFPAPRRLAGRANRAIASAGRHDGFGFAKVLTLQIRHRSVFLAIRLALSAVEISL
jgi:hypothetical protein